MNTENKPVEHPIPFMPEMVNAILEDRKTETRRVIDRKFSPEPARIIPYTLRFTPGYFAPQSNSGKMFMDKSWAPFKCRYGVPGDHLWVKEAHCFVQGDGKRGDFGVKYSADNKVLWWIDHAEKMSYPIKGNLRPAMFMPRWATRIILEVLKITAEPLQDISRADIEAEGFDSPDDFIEYWNRINGKSGSPWHKNPWVFVVKFKKFAVASEEHTRIKPK